MLTVQSTDAKFLCHNGETAPKAEVMCRAPALIASARSRALPHTPNSALITPKSVRHASRKRTIDGRNSRLGAGRDFTVKVVHVSDCFLPRLGGIETQVAELTRMQRSSGHDVEIITATPDRADARIASPVPVHRVVARLPWDLPVHPRMGHHLARLYRDLRPDVVHAHVGAVSPLAWSGVRQAAMAGIPTVVTVHSMWDPGTAMLYRFLDAMVGWTRWPGVCTAVSEAAADLIRQVVGERVPVHVVANGITFDHWRMPVDRPARRGPVHVVAVGRLAPRKQPLTLLRILRDARDGLAAGAAREAGVGEGGAGEPTAGQPTAGQPTAGQPTAGEPSAGHSTAASPLRATIVGDGPALPWMRWYLRRHRMESWVRLTGRLDRTQVRAVLADADLFVAPARRESFGLAALEARIAGVPVVAYADSGVSSFVVPEKEGLLGRSPRELSAAVVRLASDSALRTALVAHNLASLPVHCTWPVVLAYLDERYAQAMARAPVAQVAPVR
jgi:phosphatidylinositol alpha 1,6-mannosyltransferase